MFPPAVGGKSFNIIIVGARSHNLTSKTGDVKMYNNFFLKNVHLIILFFLQREYHIE